MINKDIIRKLDVSGPRYTSYPTAPQWQQEIGNNEYLEALKAFSKTDKTLSLYFHIPFCQTLCTYCGCNVVIRKQEDRFGDTYLDHLDKEIDLITGVIGTKRQVKQLHWGGGTPTFLNAGQIKRLYGKIKKSFKIEKNAEVAIEIDPRTIDRKKLQLLKKVGFNRVSFGVQDFNEDVQKAVNRIQPFDMVEQTTRWVRELKFSSVNFDLIYGLPYQSVASFSDTVQKVIGLKPDRIALYSFAYVPWLKKHQNKLDIESLPKQDVKLDIFLSARDEFLAHGYKAIAMDHFALRTDELSKAFNSGNLYRNFMGYTVKPADEYIGLGVTSIGFLQSAYFQNEKALPKYYEKLDQGKPAVERGLILSDDDRKRQWVINSLMCHFKLSFNEYQQKFNERFNDYFGYEINHIAQCMIDGLLISVDGGYLVSDLGKLFVRNICMGFDVYLRNSQTAGKYSRTI